MDFRIEVNNSMIDVREGETLLVALRRNGFRIPTMCHMNRFSPTGACRLCVVEVEGRRDLITSCSYPVEPGMKVYTNSPRVIRARKSLTELLLSSHPDDCLYCQRNGNCELQWLADEVNVKERKFFGSKNASYPDNSSTSVFRDPAKCVLCSRCVRMCEETQLVTAIDFISRADNTLVNSAFNQGLNVSSCINCGQCITVCPTAALVDISHIEKVQAALERKKQEVVFLLSPAMVASVAEETGLKPGKHLGGVVAAALRKCGAGKVYDMGAGADMNIAEEAKALRQRLQEGLSMPLISACCPSWVRYVEEFRPEWLPYLSGIKSPGQLGGLAVKSIEAGKSAGLSDSAYVVAVSVCVGNKFEITREELTHKGISEVDAVLTVRELIRMIRTFGLDMANMEPEPFDAPFDASSSAAWAMGYSGGKAESVAEEMHMVSGAPAGGFRFVIPKNLAARKESRVMIQGRELGFAWVSGIAEADAYLSRLFKENRTDIHYVEVMACPGGCAGGGGQPVNRNPEKPRNRKKICADMARLQAVRTPSEQLRHSEWFQKVGESVLKKAAPTSYKAIKTR